MGNVAETVGEMKDQVAAKLGFGQNNGANVGDDQLIPNDLLRNSEQSQQSKNPEEQPIFVPGGPDAEQNPQGEDKKQEENKAADGFDDIYLASGFNNYTNKRYEDCLNDLNMAIFYNPNNFNTLYLLSSVYCKLKNYNEAIVTLNKCLNLDPNNMKTYTKMADIYKTTGQLEKLATIEKILEEIGKDTIEYRKYILKKKMEAREYQGVIDSVDKILEIEKREEKIEFYLAYKIECLYLLYDFDTALAILLPRKENKTLSEKNYKLLIKIKIEQFEIEEAKNLISDAILLFEDREGYFKSLQLYVNLIMEKYDDIDSDLKKLIELDEELKIRFDKLNTAYNF